ncbi:uncharacterized protein LOC123506801 isoform X4 [Portunus trituberculatus]|uniref:uncharacterized protein LOC123506801 isoform X4 n=1 Tax=Portunus trituberculatus TaxID=210409 RepID=UPI001E1CE12B|nr:uncharacterized protein LOC123506801 isoform X4 [Portunus trituberculatus]
MQALYSSSLHNFQKKKQDRQAVMRVWGVSMAWTRREGVSLAAVGAVIVPMVASLVTYTFVSLPGEAIALDQTGSLVVLLVLLKIFVLGISGHLPFDLNKLWSHHGRREKRTLPYLLQESLEEDLPCTVRILCELETAARTSSEDELPDVSTLHHERTRVVLQFFLSLRDSLDLVFVKPPTPTALAPLQPGKQWGCCSMSCTLPPLRPWTLPPPQLRRNRPHHTQTWDTQG